MKKGIIYLCSFLFSCLILSFLLNSCAADDCKNVACPSGKICYKGSCYCPSGFEGENCEISSINRFIGSYDVNEYAYTGTTPAPFYTSTIQFGTTSSQVWISNFSNTNVTIVGTISTSLTTGKGTHISINDKAGVLEVSGEGDFNENLNRIDMQLNIKQEFQSRSCQVTFIKL